MWNKRKVSLGVKGVCTQTMRKKRGERRRGVKGGVECVGPSTRHVTNKGVFKGTLGNTKHNNAKPPSAKSDASFRVPERVGLRVSIAT